MPGRSVEAAFAEAERDGLRLHLLVRLGALAAVAAWLLVSFPAARALPGLGAVAAFAALGAAPYLLGRRRGRHLLWAGLFAALDVVLLVTVILVPNPFHDTGWPAQMQLRFSTALYLLVYVAGMALSYSPGLVAWTGALAAVAWSVGHLAVLGLPDTIATDGTRLIDQPGLAPTGALDLYLDPRYVSVAAWQTQTVLLLVLTAALAAAVARSRKLLRRQVGDALARANLSRYFSPNVVDRLSHASARRDGSRQEVAILFADMAGFTAAAERLEPEETMGLLRGFHGRMARAVFAHGGTLDKYIGDAVMATFGTPRPESGDALRALRCAFAMLEEWAAWNRERAARGRAPVRVSIGLHWGEAVVGDVGHERRLEYTAIGDAVNVANRLERLTRQLEVAIVVSEELAERARAEAEGDPQAANFLDRLSPRGDVRVRGRSRPITVRTADFLPSAQT